MNYKYFRAAHIEKKTNESGEIKRFIPEPVEKTLVSPDQDSEAIAALTNDGDDKKETTVSGNGNTGWGSRERINILTRRLNDMPRKKDSKQATNEKISKKTTSQRAKNSAATDRARAKKTSGSPEKTTQTKQEKTRKAASTTSRNVSSKPEKDVAKKPREAAAVIPAESKKPERTLSEIRSDNKVKPQKKNSTEEKPVEKKPLQEDKNNAEISAVDSSPETKNRIGFTRIARTAALYFLAAFMGVYILNAWLHPVAGLYGWLEQNHPQSEYLKTIEQTEDSLVAFEGRFKDSYLVQKISIVLPFVENMSFNLGLQGYFLGARERHQWNRFIETNLKAAIKNDWVNLENHNGWLLPEWNYKTKVNKVNYDAYRFVYRHRSPSDYYFFRKPPVKPDEVKAIYLTGSSSRQRSLPKYLAYVKKGPTNAVVFDVKDVTGFVNYDSDIKLVQQVQKGIPAPIGNLDDLTRKLRNEKVYSIARVSLFQDERLASVKKDWAIYKKNGKGLTVKGRLVWVDPARKDVQDYNLRLIREVLTYGVDEIQLDYIRYPAEGDWKDGNYSKIKNHYEKPEVITAFLQRVHSLTRAYGVPLSLDVFGVMAWQEKLDIKSTGQDLTRLSQAADILSPMLYPSHFGKVFAGIKNPADSPYHFLYEGTSKLKSFVPENVILRPWLQAFKWRVSNYGPHYIEEQIKGTYTAGAKGYLLWNASNKYPEYRDFKFKDFYKENEDKPGNQTRAAEPVDEPSAETEDPQKEAVPLKAELKKNNSTEKTTRMSNVTEKKKTVNRKVKKTTNVATIEKKPVALQLSKNKTEKETAPEPEEHSSEIITTEKEVTAAELDPALHESKPAEKQRVEYETVTENRISSKPTFDHID